MNACCETFLEYVCVSIYEMSEKPSQLLLYYTRYLLSNKRLQGPKRFQA